MKPAASAAFVAARWPKFAAEMLCEWLTQEKNTSLFSRKVPASPWLPPRPIDGIVRVWADFRGDEQGRKGAGASIMRPRAYKFDTKLYDGVAVVKCRDTHYHSDCAQSLSAALQAARDAATSDSVVLNMNAVRLFSSSALRAVRSSYVAAQKSGGRIVAAGGGELVVNVLKFAPFILHFETVHGALAQLSQEAADAYAKAEGE